jgi:hypothetical protein
MLQDSVMPRACTSDPTPTISRVEHAGEILIEALYDADTARTSLAVSESGSATTIVSDFTLPTGERLVPYSPRNNLLSSGSVLLPSDIGDFGDKRDLVEAVQGFIRQYVDLSPAFEEIAAHYVLLTWVYDAFSELGYLRFRGDYGTGKTRALLAVGSLCYKPFFASGASTVSPIFHVLDAFGGTLILDEADFRFSDATAELTKVLNNGTVDGLPVLRTMSNRHRELDPRAFRVFGPKVIGMRGQFSDRALESRFLTEETGQRPLRPDIPIHLPKIMKAEALRLRNRLLAWRFHARREAAPDPARLVLGIAPRLNQTALALLSIVDDAGVRERIARELVGEEARVLSERASSLEASVLAAVCEAARLTPAGAIPLKAVVQEFCRKTSGNLEPSISSKTIGFVVRTKLRLPTVKSNGNYAIPATHRAQIWALARRYGIAQTAEDVS